MWQIIHRFKSNTEMYICFIYYLKLLNGVNYRNEMKIASAIGEKFS